MTDKRFIGFCRRLVASVSALLIFVLSFNVPCASAVVNTPNIVDLPVASSISGSVPVSEVAIIGIYNANNQLYLRTTNANVCAFIYGSSPYYVVFCSLDAFSANTCGVGYAGSSYASYPNVVNETASSESYGLNYFSSSLNAFPGVTYDIQPFSSLQEGMYAAYEHLAGSSLGSSFSVPAGWVAYYRSASAATFKCYQPVASTWLGGSNQWSEGGQKYGYSASLPTSSTTFPLVGMSLIPWQKGYPRMANGNTRNSLAAISATPSGQWTVVYNPLLTNFYTEGAGDDLPNGTIEIVVTGLAEVRLYPLSVAVEDGEVIGTSNDGYEDPAIGVIDPDTGAVSFEDSNGNVVVPNVGGQNYTPEDISVQGFFNRVLQALNDLISGIGNLFGFAFEAIANLVSLAGPFFGKLAALYSWLPQPVMSALSSAMILAITIGVLKSFL